jgi:hypothetical protein
MDVPFGWPTAFVQSVTAHAQRKQLPSVSTQQLRFRVTDHNLKLLTGKWPRQRPDRLRLLLRAWPDCRQYLPHNARARITQTRRNTAVHLKERIKNRLAGGLFPFYDLSSRIHLH